MCFFFVETPKIIEKKVQRDFAKAKKLLQRLDFRELYRCCTHVTLSDETVYQLIEQMEEEEKETTESYPTDEHADSSAATATAAAVETPPRTPTRASATDAATEDDGSNESSLKIKYAKGMELVHREIWNLLKADPVFSSKICDASGDLGFDRDCKCEENGDDDVLAPRKFHSSDLKVQLVSCHYGKESRHPLWEV